VLIILNRATFSLALRHDRSYKVIRSHVCEFGFHQSNPHVPPLFLRVSLSFPPETWLYSVPLQSYSNSLSLVSLPLASKSKEHDLKVIATSHTALFRKIPLFGSSTFIYSPRLDRRSKLHFILPSEPNLCGKMFPTLFFPLLALLLSFVNARPARLETVSLCPISLETCFSGSSFECVDVQVSLPSTLPENVAKN